MKEIDITFDKQSFDTIKVNITTEELERFWREIGEELNKRYATKTISK